MAHVDTNQIEACKAQLSALLPSDLQKDHPALLTIRCIDPRHNNRTVISVTRQHYLEDTVGSSLIQDMIKQFGYKTFNLAANEIVKNFDLTSLGGRYSFNLSAVLGFIVKPKVRQTGVRLKRIYTTDHEGTHCLAALFEERIEWSEALRRILADLSIPNYPDRVDIYTGQVATNGSRPSNIALSAKYLGPNESWEILNIPHEM